MASTIISNREIYLRIVEHSLISNRYITLALKDNYRQSGQVKDIKISFAKDSDTINGTISFYEGFEFNLSEITDVYS